MMEINSITYVITYLRITFFVVAIIAKKIFSEPKYVSYNNVFV